MRIKLDHMYFCVEDMEKAVNFYELFLGVKATHREGDRWADFEIEGQDGMYFGLYEPDDVQDSPYKYVCFGMLDLDGNVIEVANYER